MRTSNFLIASLLVALYGCQPEISVQQTAVPATAIPPSTAPELSTPVVSETIATPSQSLPADKPTLPSGKDNIAAVQTGKISPPAATIEPAQSNPIQVPDALPAKTEPPPDAAAKSAATPEPVLTNAEATQLAKSNNCFSCHAVGKKVVGPSFKDVAIKYRDETGAEAKLIAKIAKGGSGVWGVMVMPPSPKINESDRRNLTRWILSLK